MMVSVHLLLALGVPLAQGQPSILESIDICDEKYEPLVSEVPCGEWVEVYGCSPTWPSLCPGQDHPLGAESNHLAIRDACPDECSVEGDVNGEDYCQGPAMIRNEEGCKASGCCHWNTWEAGEASFWGEGRCWSSIGQAICEDKQLVRECNETDSTLFFSMIGGYQHIDSVREQCMRFVADPKHFTVEEDKAACDCIDTMFDEDIVETISGKLDCTISDESVGHPVSVEDHLRSMQRYCHTDHHDEENHCEDSDKDRFFQAMGQHLDQGSMRAACSRFVDDPDSFDLDTNWEPTCECLETLFDEDLTEDLTSDIDCEIPIEDGEAMSIFEYLRYMKGLCAAGPSECVDDPSGIVAADPHKDCSNVGDYAWWSCDYFDADFNGHSVFIWELCPKSCGVCEDQPSAQPSEYVFEMIHVGQVMSWYDYRDLAWQKGGRLPTAMELRENGVSVDYDQWVPVTPMDGDHTTGRDDGDVTNGEENAWANIGPRKYVTEFPAWGLDSESYDWKRLDYFYMVSRGGDDSSDHSSKNSSEDDDSRECQDEDAATFWAVVGGYQHLPEIREQCGRFVRNHEQFGAEGNEEATCGCLETMFEEDIVETVASRLDCDRIEVDDREYMTPVEYLEHMRHSTCHGDHDDDSRECQDEDGATFWAMVGGYQHLPEIREQCGRFVRNYEQFGAEGNEEATCGCLETMFEKDIVETVASRMDCDRIEVDDGEYMSPVEYLEYIMHYSCHDEHEPEGINGEEACEGHDFDYDRCMEVGCCHWNPDLGCMSDVGRETCHAASECDSQTGPAFWAVVGGYRHLPSINEKCWRFVQDQTEFWLSLGNARQASGVPADPEWKPACECVEAMFENDIVETVGKRVNCYIPGEHFGNAMTFHLTSYLRHMKEVCGEHDMKICTDDDFQAVFVGIQDNGDKVLREACPVDMEDHAGYCKCLTEVYNPRNIMLVEDVFPKCHVDLSMPGRWHPDTGSNNPVLMREYLRYDLIECMEYGHVVDPTPGANGEPLSKTETQDVLRNVLEELKMLNKGDLPSARKNLKLLDLDAKTAKQKLKKFAKRVSKKLQN